MHLCERNYGSDPDITVVPLLAQQLGVSSDELIGASENPEERHNQRDARVYRKWRTVLLWSTSIAYGTTILTSFIVNISVQHTISWFWVVLAAVALAFSLTTLPLLQVPRRGWFVLGASLVSLLALLGVISLLYGSGAWVPIAIAATLLAVVLCFAPIWLAGASLPAPFNSHRTVLSLAISTVAIVAFLWVIMLAIGQPQLWISPTLLLVAIGLAPVWIIALVIRYLPGSGLARAAVVAALVGVFSFVIDPLVNRALGASEPRQIDLTQWNETYVSGNIEMLILVGCLLTAAALGIAAMARASRR